METLTMEYTSVIRKRTDAVAQLNMDYTAARKAALVLRALSHEIRKDIISLLEQNKRMQVTDIYTALGLQQAVASQHLAVLRKAKIVSVEYTSLDCRVIYYSLNQGRIGEMARICNSIG